MRKIKKSLKIGLLLLGALLVFWNCEDDTNTIVENPIAESENSLNQDDITIEILSFEKFKDFPLYSQLDNYVKFNSKSRISKKSEHKFKIHKDIFKKITKNNSDYTSYTFLITDTEKYEYTTVKNLVINHNKDKIEVFVFTYSDFTSANGSKYSINENANIEQLFDFDISELGDLASKDLIKYDENGNPIDDPDPDNGGSTYCYSVSIIVSYPCYGNGATGTHYHDSDCNCNDSPGGCNSPTSDYYSDTFCTTEFNSTTAAATYTPSSNLTGGGTTTTTVDSNDDIIVSSIIENEIPEGADPLAFKLGLDYAQSSWLVNVATEQQYDAIGLFFEENNGSAEAKEFVIFAIQALNESFHKSKFSELLEILDIEQEYRGRMSQNELIIFDSLDRHKQLKYLQSAYNAEKMMESLYPPSNLEPCMQYNGKGDAYRHALWNALSTVRIGETLTEQLTTAHEDVEIPSNYPDLIKEIQMDLYNNARGREIASGAGLLWQLVKNTLENGELRYLTPLNIPTNCRATSSSLLTPTN